MCYHNVLDGLYGLCIADGMCCVVSPLAPPPMPNPPSPLQQFKAMTNPDNLFAKYTVNS